MSADILVQLAAFIERHPRLLVLTGAGMSTASGIPDYRDKDGVRRGTPPVQGPEFRKSDAVRRRYWARSMVGYPHLARAQPNDGHKALAALQERALVDSIMTQNVDGLHQQAGSEDVLELHGNIHSVLCLECRATFSREHIQHRLVLENPQMRAIQAQSLPDGDARLEPEALSSFKVPCCVHCGGMLQPHVVFFGDGVPAERSRQAIDSMERADSLLIIGSSLIVFSGFRFCRMAAAAGKPIAAINQGKTRADDMFALKIADSAEQVLPALLARLS